MSDLDILQKLQGAVRDHAVPDSIAPSLPVKYLGIPWTVPSNQKYLELVHIPNNRIADFWGNEKNYQGIFRMILHWPNNGGGAYTPMETISSIASYFTKDLRLPGVQIMSEPDFTGLLEMGSETLYPVSLRYQSYRK